MKPATCRFLFARGAMLAIVAVAHCALLHAGGIRPFRERHLDSPRLEFVSVLAAHSSAFPILKEID